MTPTAEQVQTGIIRLLTALEAALADLRVRDRKDGVRCLHHRRCPAARSGSVRAATYEDVADCRDGYRREACYWRLRATVCDGCYPMGLANAVLSTSIREPQAVAS